MAVVSGGLGQPESGAIVAGGLAAAGAPSGFRNATLTVTATATSSITADVLGGEEPPPDPPSTAGGGARIMPRRILPEPRRKTTFVDARMSVHCKSSAAITADVTVNFDAELEELLLVGAL